MVSRKQSLHSSSLYESHTAWTVVMQVCILIIKNRPRMYRQHYSMALFIHSYFSMVVFLHTFMTHLYDILLQDLK